MKQRGERAKAKSGAAEADPKSLADALAEALAAHALDLAAPSAAIGDRWEAIVGRDVAAHCQPVGMKAGVLHADVDSSVWCQQLQLRSPEILAALRESMGPAAPTELRFRVGYARRPAGATSKDQPPRNEPHGERDPFE